MAQVGRPAEDERPEEGGGDDRHHDPDAETLMEGRAQDDAEDSVDRAPTRTAGRGRNAGRDETPTQIEPASESADSSSAARARPSTAPSSSVERSQTSARMLGPTPLETLRIEEIHRTRAFVRIAIVFAVIVAASAPLVGRDPVSRSVVLVGMTLVASACAWLGWHIRQDAGYTSGRALVAACACVVGALSGIYYYGVFSPAAVVVPFGLYFFALAQDVRATVVAFVSCAAGYALLGLGMIAGVFVDRGVVQSGGVAILDRLVIVSLVEVTFVATYFMARASRRASLHAVEQHDRVVRSLSQREALLREARQELQRALAAGGVGHFTDEVLGSYRLGSVLGRGAMGEVYEATHVATNEDAAVKVLQGHLLSNPDHVRRFLREAKLVASLKVEQVVRVLEIGGVDATTPYIAMERLRGVDLADLIRRRRRLTPKKTLQLARDVAAALVAAREAGIVHRDLKPRNLFFAERAGDRAIWKVLDFGVSKLAGAHGTLTQDRLVGTPAYMAPEQARGKEVTHASDVYALGVICYRALTGRPPFTGKDVPETVYNVVYTMPPAPSSVESALGESIDAFLAVAMAKDPVHRFATAEELVAAFEEAIRDELRDSVRARARKALAEHPWGRFGRD